MSEEKKLTEEELIDPKGRMPIFLRLGLTVLVIVMLCEFIGKITIPAGVANIVLLPMLYAVVIGIIITPDVLGKPLKFLQKIISKDEIELAEPLVMIALLPLGVKYGTLVGPNIVKVVQAGPAFLLQEFGNLGTMVLALPLALLLGMKREAVGGTMSISREVTLGIIGEKYGISSPEGTGVLGTYLMGTIFGTVIFSFIGTLSVYTGLHPLALAMACGMGSGSMMTASAAALAATVPKMSEQILAYAATSNMLTGVTGLYMELFIALPLVNFLYRKLEPVISRKKAGKGANDEA